jgi:hypothetical protein
MQHRDRVHLPSDGLRKSKVYRDEGVPFRAFSPWCSNMFHKVRTHCIHQKILQSTSLNGRILGLGVRLCVKVAMWQANLVDCAVDKIFENIDLHTYLVRLYSRILSPLVIILFPKAKTTRYGFFCSKTIEIQLLTWWKSSVCILSCQTWWLY